MTLILDLDLDILKMYMCTENSVFRLRYSKVKALRGHTATRCCFRDLDLDPMTFIYELDLYILKTYLHAKMKFIGQDFQKLEHSKTDRHRQTDSHRQPRPKTLPSHIREL